MKYRNGDADLIIKFNCWPLKDKVKVKLPENYISQDVSILYPESTFIIKYPQGQEEQ